MLFPYHDDNPIRRVPFITVLIIATNIAAAIYSSRLDVYSQRILHARFGFVPARIGQLVKPDARVVVDLIPERPERVNHRFLVLPADRQQIGLSLITCMFLHGGVMHLAGNLWFFWIFGNNIEDRLGHFVFLCLYLCGGITASIGHWVMIPESQVMTPVIGASGAVAVMLGAYAVTYPFARIRCVLLLCLPFFIELPALLVLGVWIFGQVVSGMDAINLNLNGGVAWWAHIVGFAAGALIMPMLKDMIPESPLRDSHRLNEFGLSRDGGLSDKQWKNPGLKRNAPTIRHDDPNIRWMDD